MVPEDGLIVFGLAPNATARLELKLAVVTRVALLTKVTPPEASPRF